MRVDKNLGDILAAGKLLEELFHHSPVALALLLLCDCNEPDSCAAIFEQVEPRSANALVLKLQDQREVIGSSVVGMVSLIGYAFPPREEFRAPQIVQSLPVIRR